MFPVKICFYSFHRIFYYMNIQYIKCLTVKIWKPNKNNKGGEAYWLFWGVRFYTNISASSSINTRQTRVQMSLYRTCWCQRCYILLRFAVCRLRLKRFKATSCIQQTPYYDFITFTAYIKEHSNRPLLNRLCNLELFGFCLFEEYVNVLTSTSPSPLHWHTSLA